MDNHFWLHSIFLLYQKCDEFVAKLVQINSAQTIALNPVRKSRHAKNHCESQNSKGAVSLLSCWFSAVGNKKLLFHLEIRIIFAMSGINPSNIQPKTDQPRNRWTPLFAVLPNRPSAIPLPMPVESYWKQSFHKDPVYSRRASPAAYSCVE